MATLEQLYEHLKGLNKQWFYEKNEIDTNFIRKNNTNGLVKNDGTIDTSTYLTATDISGKANSSDLHAIATSGSYLDLEDVPSTFAPSAHTHQASEVTDSSAYTNLGTSADATQHAINYAIDSKIGQLLSIELVEVAASLPTASANTMNKLYLVAEETTETNDAYEIFVTVQDGSSYDWEKVDKARIDLSNYASVDHVHGNITNDGKIGSNSDYFVTTTTGGLVTSQASIGNINTDGEIGSSSGKVITTSANGVLTASDWVDEVDSIIQALTTYGNSL